MKYVQNIALKAFFIKQIFFEWNKNAQKDLFP